MKVPLILFCFNIIVMCGFSGKSIPLNNNHQKSRITFTENKGQVSDQNYIPRPDVLFSGFTSSVQFHLKKTGISYQLTKINSWKKPDTSNFSKINVRGKAEDPDQGSIYRIDINWLGINQNYSIQCDASIQGYNNYYSSVCPNGVRNVKSFYGITYKDIYRDIDLHFYGRNKSLKYDYIVRPHADYKKIKLEIKGAISIHLKSDGSLLIHTPLGDLIEDKPLVFQNGKKIEAKWNLKGNILSFEIENYNSDSTLVIDPIVRLWGTYYGGDYDDVGRSCSVDRSKNVFLAGYTNSQMMIATSGAYQSTFGSPQPYSWNKDAFLAKFDSAGVRQWGTYYGTYGYDAAYSCATDALGNTYLTGECSATTLSVLATSGAFLTSPGGGFLAKFDNAGARIWATYYYGAGSSCATDASNNVYMVGTAPYGQTPIGTIATANAYQTTFEGWYDCFLTKFDANGVRQWGTYYGGSQTDYATRCCTDINKNVYLSGYTESDSLISTPLAYQVNYGGSQDAFLAKFDSLGIRQWATYYGAAGLDWSYSACTDLSGNVYLSGTTPGGTVIATNMSHQPNYGGGLNDGFVVKFNALGVRLWATFYGGADDDYAIGCSTDRDCNLYLCGRAASGSTGTTIATINGPQNYNAGGNTDAFLVKFDTNGVRLLGTYYGGGYNDEGISCAADLSGNIYLAGFTNSGDNISSSNSHQDSLSNSVGWNYDAFLVKFGACTFPNPPINSSPPVNEIICANKEATLTVVSDTNADINWYSTLTDSNSVATGSMYVSQILNPGTYTFYAAANACGINTSRTPITLTVNAIPIVTLSASSNSICAGATTTLSASGANSYSWSTGSFDSTLIISPDTTTNYTVAGTNILGCMSDSIQTTVITVLANPILNVSITPSIICVGETATMSASGAVTYSENGVPFNQTIVLSPLSNSQYNVIGTDQNGCISSPILVTQSVGICSGLITIGLKDQNLLLYPNPNNGVFFIETTSPMSIKILTALGQVVAEQRLTEGKNKIKLSEFPPGIYFVNYISGSLKVIKD